MYNADMGRNREIGSAHSYLFTNLISVFDVSTKLETLSSHAQIVSAPIFHFLDIRKYIYTVLYGVEIKQSFMDYYFSIIRHSHPIPQLVLTLYKQFPQKRISLYLQKHAYLFHFFLHYIRDILHTALLFASVL